MAILALASMTSWLAPTSLFVFLNLVIATIYLTSRLASPPPSSKNPESFYSHHPPPPPLARAPSLIDRFRSIKFSTYNFPEPETSFADHSVQLHRAPSILDRVRCINLTTYKFPEPEPGHPVQVLRRAPSLLERVRSINMSSFYTSEPEHRDVHLPAGENMRKSASERAVAAMDDEAEEEREEERRADLTRAKSESVLQKTASIGDEAVDAKADDFINRFKDQLRLQRLESILRSKA